MSRVSALVLLLCAFASFGIAACGSSEEMDGLVVVAVDCSRSVRGQQKQWLEAIEGIATETLVHERKLRIGCFAGRLTGIRWFPLHVRESLGPLTGGAIERTRIRHEEAERLVSELQGEITVENVAGTDWLSAIEAAGNQRGVYRVYLFSDLVQQAEGIDLARHMAPGEVRAIAERWGPRLKRLRGKVVVSIGGGQKLSGEAPDTEGVLLFEDLAGVVPFRGEVLSTYS